ncbi:rhamnulokinase [Bacteroidales bacterium OttesenSCG-928-A17]|nr:rhamnulokinase [Bacteroidales bacterium OttesenSCG-928-A17]
MSSKHHFLAFDLGATSGRSILGSYENGIISIKELTRFPNKIVQIKGKYYWNLFSLYEELIRGIKAASKLEVQIESIGIDTWGVDFAYIGSDESILSIPRSYRDPYTEGMPEAYFNMISKEELYLITGIQTSNYNSIFQLYAAKKEESASLSAAKNILFTPDALSFLLTENKVCEYTIASTSQLLNPRTKQIEKKLLEVMGLNPELLPSVVFPGTKVGMLNESIVKECRLKKNIPVVAVAGHDTASAIVSIPAKNSNFAYLSSGTWSLMGIEVDNPIINEKSYRHNFTNEGGVNGTIRFMKNITGMWLLEQCRKEWEATGTDYSYPEIVAMAESTEGFQSFVDPDNPSFANPASMIEAIKSNCAATNQKIPQTHAEFIRCIFDSLALKYKYTFSLLKEMSPFPIDTLHIIGGGSQNKLLNQYTANALGIPVVAGPSEATAVGNIMIQAQALNLVHSLEEIRSVVSNSFHPETFLPQDGNQWDEAYNFILRNNLFFD